MKFFEEEEYGTTNNIDNLNAFNANTDLATKKFNVITIEPSSTTTQLRSTLDQSEVEEDLVEKATTSLTEAIAELRKQHDEIQVLKKDRMFDDEITEKEMEIIEKRVKLQQEQFKEFQSRDLKRKYKRFKQEWEFLTLEEVELALKETNENEEQAFLNFTDKTYIAKIRKNLCLNGSDVVISEEVKLEREKLVKRRVNLVKRVASDALKNKGSGRFKGARLDVALKQLENCEDKEEVFSGWSAARTTAYKAIDTNPNSYYYRFNAPGEKQKNGQWDALFMARLREWGEVGQWGIFSQKIPGRVGYQCSNFYRLLLKNGEVKDENYYIDEEGQSHYLFGKKEGKEGVVRRNSKHWKEENKGKVGINNSCNNSNINNENTKFGGVKKRKSRSKLKKNIHEEDEDIDMEDEIDFDEFDSHYSSSSNNTGNPSSHNQTLGSEQDGKDESGYQPLKNPKRLKKDNRCEKVFTEKNLNPLPGFIDPITLDEVIKPAISPFGHVMSYESWTRCLSDPDRKNICPLTKKSLTKRELVVLTHENIEEYRDKIVNK
ncbi:hypothetical protein HK099_000589 [Clydaea vesicula]|uniref:Myb-like domain-containing protein n=1 Tax=Clydaea vesicula TaxID=447962 RepID=A0AAD5XXI1_9FUNG|nr:hypothetical protein HK099_000589 [Clydaea vesicula]